MNKQDKPFFFCFVFCFVFQLLGHFSTDMDVALLSEVNRYGQGNVSMTPYVEQAVHLMLLYCSLLRGLLFPFSHWMLLV